MDEREHDARVRAWLGLAREAAELVAASLNGGDIEGAALAAGIASSAMRRVGELLQGGAR